MTAPATIARKHIMGLLDGTVVPDRYPLPRPLTRWDRNMPLEQGEESAFADYPFELIPVSEETGSQTISDQDKDTRHIWRLRVGFLLGDSMHALADDLEDMSEHLRRLINTAMNWHFNVTAQPIENCIITGIEFAYARPPDRRAVLRATVRCDVTDDWTTGM